LHTHAKGPLWGWWWPVDPKLIFEQLVTPVPEIIDDSFKIVKLDESTCYTGRFAQLRRCNVECTGTVPLLIQTRSSPCCNLWTSACWDGCCRSALIVIIARLIALSVAFKYYVHTNPCTFGCVWVMCLILLTRAWESHK
jgi:hypothetical protein